MDVQFYQLLLRDYGIASISWVVFVGSKDGYESISMQIYRRHKQICNRGVRNELALRSTCQMKNEYMNDRKEQNYPTISKRKRSYSVSRKFTGIFSVSDTCLEKVNYYYL